MARRNLSKDSPIHLHSLSLLCLRCVSPLFLNCVSPLCVSVLCPGIVSLHRDFAVSLRCFVVSVFGMLPLHVHHSPLFKSASPARALASESSVPHPDPLSLMQSFYHASWSFAPHLVLLSCIWVFYPALEFSVSYPGLLSRIGSSVPNLGFLSCI